MLKDKEKLRFQEKLAHFLRSHRYQTGLQQKDVAQKLGYTPSRYSELESSDVPASRYIRALEFLYTLCSVNNTPLTDFVQFLEGNSSRTDAKGNLVRSLTVNEQKTLNLLDQMPAGTSADFVKLVNILLKKSKIRPMLNLMVSLQNVDVEDLEKIQEAIKVFQKIKS